MRRRLPIAVACVVLAVVPYAAVTMSRAATAEASKPEQSRAPLTLEDAPEPLAPQKPLTEEEQDRIEARALFAAGRLLERRDDNAGALRKYQRALRSDPTSGAILEGIIDTASQLRRDAELTRYARKAVDIAGADVLLLSRLGLRLTEQGDWDLAAAMYEKVLTAHAKQPQSTTDILIRTELGKLYHLLEKYPQGAEHFLRVVKILDDPKKSGIDDKTYKEMVGEQGALFVLIGECFLLSGKYPEALAAFEKANTIAPDKALDGLNRARVEAKTGKLDEALRHLQDYFAAKATKEGMLPYRVLAEILKAQGKEQELIGRLEKLRANDPDSVPLGYFLAEEHRERKQWSQAEGLYQTLLKKNPNALGLRGLVEVYRQTNRPAELLDTLGRTAARFASLESLGSEIKAVLADTNLVDRLIDVGRKKLADAPNQVDYGVRLVLALLAMERKQYDAAGKFYQQAIESQSSRTNELMLEWGLGLLVGNQLKEAAEVFERGREKASADAASTFSYYLASALAAAKRYDDALGALRKALAANPTSARLAMRLGWVLYLKKNYDEAAKTLRDVVKKFDRDHQSQESRFAVREARLILSNIAVAQKRTAEAEQWLEQILDECPDDVSALNDLGYLWIERGSHLRRGMRMVQRAVEAEPDNAAYRDSLGWAHYQLGEYPQAVTELEKAAKAEKPDPTIYDHLGDAYRKAGQADKAREAYQKALELFRKESEQDKAKQVELKLKNK